MEITRLLLTATTALAFAATAPAAIIAVDPVENGSGVLFVNPNTLGWTFTPSVNLTVTSLGYYDFLSDGLTLDHQVGIWVNGGSLLGSATVTAAAPLLDGFRYVAAPAISLLAGQLYVIGGFQQSGDDNVLTQGTGYSTLNTAPQITYGGPRASFSNSFTRPDAPPSPIGGVFGPNFQFEVTAIPEPGTALFGLALLGAVHLRRRR